MKEDAGQGKPQTVGNGTLKTASEIDIHISSLKVWVEKCNFSFGVTNTSQKDTTAFNDLLVPPKPVSTALVILF